MNLFKRKPKFVYDFSGCKQFEEKEIHDPYELVKHMVDEDNRFQRDYFEGEVTISKVKNDIHGTIYYAEQFHLPQEEGFNWLEALSPFFTKKPLEYTLDDVSVGIGESSEEQAKKLPEKSIKSSEPFTLEAFESALQIDEEKLSEEINSAAEENSNVEKSLNAEKSPFGVTEEKVIQVSQIELESLQIAIQEQKKETERLREEIDRRDRAIEAQSIAVMSETEQQTISTVDTLSEQLDSLTVDAVSDESVPDVIHLIKTEFDQVLSKFIQTETAKIEADIQQLDKRSQIKKIVSERMKNEEIDQINQLNEQLMSEKEQAVSEENLRHQNKLHEIASSFERQSKEQVKAIQLAYQEKLTNCIKEEYEKQTEQLTRVLQGKKDELRLRQQTMNAGLKANFQEALDNFNREHNEVIQQVEEKKKSSPIDLAERLKVRQA